MGRRTIIELTADTPFYKKGTKAYLIKNSSQGNSKKCEVRFLNEHYEGGDVDVLPKYLFSKNKTQII